jgi:hypothetical protein
MKAIARMLSHALPETRSDGPLKTIVIFCGVGLVVSLMLAVCGVDLGAGLF